MYTHPGRGERSENTFRTNAFGTLRTRSDLLVRTSRSKRVRLLVYSVFAAFGTRFGSGRLDLGMYGLDNQRETVQKAGLLIN
jgi:hypothetical protein